MKPLIAAIVLVMINAASSFGQMKIAAAELNALPQQTHGKEADLAFDAKKATELSRVAERESIAKTIPSVVAKMVAEQGTGATELLRDGHTVHMTSGVVATDNIMEQRSINVEVTYDARPVGGIINIRVELIPFFGGIGSAVRPAVVRQFAQAVDDFDDDFISHTIVQLADEISSEYASK